MAFQLVKETTEPIAYTFKGKAEKCTYEFSTLPEQVPGEAQLAKTLIDKNARELEAQGVRMLKIRVYRDTEPTWQTNYRVEVWATASPIFWTPIIVGVLAVLALVITWKIIEEVKDIDWGEIPTEVTVGVPAAVILVAILGILLVLPRVKRGLVG